VRSIAVVVQACPAPGRPGWPEVQASIEASDIGKNYQLCFQPPELTIRQHFVASMQQGAAVGADLVLRLEDDIDVSRHILHNLGTWPLIDDPSFGLGWAFDPGGAGYSTYDRKWRHTPTKSRWETKLIAYSQAVLCWTRDVPELLLHCERWFAEHPKSPCEQDLALSNAAIHGLGRRIAVHSPSLVEHRLELSSQLDHAHQGVKAAHSNGSFFKDWRRGDPVYDRHGRRVTERA
jgi:hypothetical protein